MCSISCLCALCVKLRNRLEEELSMSLTEFKHFIDEEMITVMQQMDAPSQIFDYLYLGSEWNASNLDELKELGYVLLAALATCYMISDLKLNLFTYCFLCLQLLYMLMMQFI